jgi:hypothetical protein
MRLEKLTVSTQPTFEPLAREEVKTYLAIPFADHDALIDTLITAARQWLEPRIGRALALQTLLGVWELDTTTTMPHGPLSGSVASYGRELTLELLRAAPLGSVSLAEIETDLMVYKTMNSALDYVVDSDREPARLWLRASAIAYWAPTGAVSTYMGKTGPRIRVTYTAGYASQAVVPPEFKRAMLAAIAVLYEQRDGNAVIPDSIVANLQRISRMGRGAR